MSKDLKKRGFNFVGTTICYAFMQAVGMVNDHAVGFYGKGQVHKAKKYHFSYITNKVLFNSGLGSSIHGRVRPMVGDAGRGRAGFGSSGGPSARAIGAGAWQATGGRHQGLAARQHEGVACSAWRRSVPGFFAFDPRRSAVLLIGGNKRGDGRFYEAHGPVEYDRFYDEYLKEIEKEGRI